jgi:hypothetical protein
MVAVFGIASVEILGLLVLELVNKVPEMFVSDIVKKKLHLIFVKREEHM